MRHIIIWVNSEEGSINMVQGRYFFEYAAAPMSYDGEFYLKKML